MKPTRFDQLKCLGAAWLLAALPLRPQTPDFKLVGFGSGATGGQGGPEVKVSTLSQLKSAAESEGKRIIKVEGTITGGGAILEVTSNKSILGVGDKAHLKGIGFHLKNTSNVIFRNLKMTMIGGGAKDIINAETTGSKKGGNYWIDHCEFYNERPTLPASASKKDKYDGMFDFKKSVSNITVSWNYIHDHWKCSLVGFSTDKDKYDRKITFHHNWFQNIKSRVPSYRSGTAHVYNNFYDGLQGPDAPSSEGVHARDGACLYVEGNYFLNYSKSVYWHSKDSPTESYVNESGAPNIYINSPKNTAPACDSFKPPYSVKVDKAEAVPDLVRSCSGIGKLEKCEVKISAVKSRFISSPLLNGSSFLLSLPADEATIVILYNFSGQKIMQRTAIGPVFSLNTANLSNGIYFATATYMGRTTLRSIVKK